MLEFFYILLILISMPFFIKKENWSFLACFLYVGCCLMMTPFLGIPLFKYVFRG